MVQVMFIFFYFRCRIVRHLKSVHGASWRERIHSTPSTVNPTLEIPAAGSKSGIISPLTINNQSSTKSVSGAQMTAAPIRTLSDEERFGQLKEKGNAFVKKVGITFKCFS